MLGEEFGHLGLDRLGQQGARSVAQHLGKRVGERPWLKQLDDVSIGHGVSLLCWRSGGSNTPTIRRLLPVRPSPTFAHSSAFIPSEAKGIEPIDMHQLAQSSRNNAAACSEDLGFEGSVLVDANSHPSAVRPALEEAAAFQSQSRRLLNEN